LNKYELNWVTKTDGMISPYTKQTELLMVLHYSHLLERDRRHYAATEAVKLGRGGTSYISKLLVISRTTITSATKQLEALASSPPILVNRQRKAGGGRKKKDGKAS
jgi:hypothetical protein